MKKARKSPSYKGLAPSSPNSTRTARACSAKRDTAPERLLRRALKARKLRFHVDALDLPGRPDIALRRERLAVFCDGDFWHGRNLRARLAKLAGGHNGAYWVAKIQSNVERDRRIETELEVRGWRFLRFWESDVRASPEAAADSICKAVRGAAKRLSVRTGLRSRGRKITNGRGE